MELPIRQKGPVLSSGKHRFIRVMPPAGQHVGAHAAGAGVPPDRGLDSQTAQDVGENTLPGGPLGQGDAELHSQNSGLPTTTGKD